MAVAADGPKIPGQQRLRPRGSCLAWEFGHLLGAKATKQAQKYFPPRESRRLLKGRATAHGRQGLLQKMKARWDGEPRGVVVFIQKARGRENAG